MSLIDQRHTVRLSMPDLIVRGVNHTIYAPIYLDGALVAPTAAAAVSVYDESNTAIVDNQPAAVTGSIAQYTITGATTTSLALSERWRVEWSLPISGGPTLTPRNSAALVRNALWPVISDVDLYRRMPALDPNGSAPIHADADLQDQIDEAWTEINLRLISRGNRPNLILEPSALREVHVLLSLALKFDDLASRLDPAYRDEADRYRERFETAWSALSPLYDVADDGRADTRRRAAVPSVWLSSRAGADRGW